MFDWGWADAAERAGIDYYPKLLVGVPFTPVTGARFLTAHGTDRARAIAQLGAGLRELCDRHQISGAHVNFCLPDERDALAEAGYLLRVGHPVPLAQRGLRDLRRLSRPPAQQAPQPGEARAAQRARAGGHDRGAARRRDPRRGVRADVPLLPRDRRRALLRPPLPEPRVLRAAARAVPPPALLRGGAARRRDRRGHHQRGEGRRALRPLLGRRSRRSATSTSTSATTPRSSTASRRASLASSPARAATTSSCAASTRSPPTACTTSPIAGSRTRSSASSSPSARRPRIQLASREQVEHLH